MEIMSDEEKMMWDEAREWAVAEILAKHRDELMAAHSKHFRRLTMLAQPTRLSGSPADKESDESAGG